VLPQRGRLARWAETLSLARWTCVPPHPLVPGLCRSQKCASRRRSERRPIGSLSVEAMRRRPPHGPDAEVPDVAGETNGGARPGVGYASPMERT
jgi:hypothetical protein